MKRSGWFRRLRGCGPDGFGHGIPRAGFDDGLPLVFGAGGLGCTVHTRVSAAMPPLRSTLIFMASFLGFPAAWPGGDWPALPAFN